MFIPFLLPERFHIAMLLSYPIYLVSSKPYANLSSQPSSVGVNTEVYLHQIYFLHSIYRHTSFGCTLQVFTSFTNKFGGSFALDKSINTIFFPAGTYYVSLWHVYLRYIQCALDQPNKANTAIKYVTLFVLCFLMQIVEHSIGSLSVYIWLSYALENQQQKCMTTLLDW